MNQKEKGLLLVLGTAIISGFSIFINKYGVAVINPYVFTGLKNVLTALFLAGIILGTKNWSVLKRLSKKQWSLLLLIGLVGGSIPFLLFFKGLSSVNSAQGSFIHKTMFIFVAFLASFFLKEKIDKKFFIGGLLLMLSNFLLLKNLSFSFNRGALLIFLAVLFWAAENILSKYALKELSGKIVGWGRMFFGSLFILFFLAATGQLSLAAHLNLKQFNWTFITAILLLGYVFSWYHGLKFIPVSQATVILTLGSPVTTLLNFIAGSAINGKEILAGIIVVLGVISVFGLRQILALIKKINGLIYVRT